MPSLGDSLKQGPGNKGDQSRIVAEGTPDGRQVTGGRTIIPDAGW
jgi:hypothetical protein